MSTTYYAGYINTIPNDKQSFQSSYSASTIHNSRWLLPHSCGQQIHSDPESKVIFKVTNSITSWLVAPPLSRKVGLWSDFATTKFHFRNSLLFATWCVKWAATHFFYLFKHSFYNKLQTAGDNRIMYSEFLSYNFCYVIQFPLA